MNTMSAKVLRYFDTLAAVSFFVIPLIRFWEVISKGKIMVFGDGIINIAQRSFVYQNVYFGEWPLWNQYVGIGAPLFSDTTTAFFYPLNALALVFSPVLFSNIYYVLHLGLAALFAYFFFRQNGIDKLAALAGSMIFSASIMLGGSRREHVAVYTAIVWVPLILFFIQRYVMSQEKRYLLLAAFVMAIQFSGGHLQYVLYADILAFFYLVYYSMAAKVPLNRLFRAILLWITAYVLFIAVALIPLFQLFAQSGRNEADYFSLFAMSWKLLVMTVFPRALGANLTHPLGMDGSAEVSIEIYMGIVPVMYALYAARYHFSNRLVRFGVAAIMVSLVWAMGPTIPYLSEVFRKIPILNLFGVQSRALFLFGFFLLVCSTIGIADIGKREYAVRLLSHAFVSFFLIVILALILSVAGMPSHTSGFVAPYFGLESSAFIISILIAAANLFLMVFLYLMRSNSAQFPSVSAGVLSLLLIITLLDLDQFAQSEVEIDYGSLVNTAETAALRKLLREDSYRVMVIYDELYGGDYQKSGLVDNWGMVNKIRNIKGFQEFENARVNELLNQTESRDNRNGRMLISKGDIISMLAVKYVLIPLDEPAPRSIPSIADALVIDRTGSMKIPGNGELFVQSFPISVDAGKYYRVDFDVDAQDAEVELFYVDLYGGPEYDYTDQNQTFLIRQGSHHYSGNIYSGDTPLLASPISFRLVAITSRPLIVSNLKVVRLVSPPRNPNYVLVDRTNRYQIYENIQAQELLYIPTQVKAITDAGDLRKNPDKYPHLDRISYVSEVEDGFPTGTLTVESIKNNKVRVHVGSPDGTFITHAQSYDSDWKAYIDGKPTPIYLVNGVIQGVAVPPGEHQVDFRYSPWSLKVGGIISCMAYTLAATFMIYEKRHRANTI